LPEDAQEMIGRTLGRYRLTDRIGDEGPGEVYRADDTVIERQVELWLLPASAVDPARLDRLRQEAERAAAFVHPNVATLYGLEEAEGRFFVTSQPMADRSLASLLREREIAPQDALEVAVALSDVLTAAQEAGVVHGGLRPADVKLAADGTIVVTGFGLGEWRRAAEAEMVESSPESSGLRVAPPALPPDHRDDIFAFGRILEEMIPAGDPAGGDGQLPEKAASGLRRLLRQCLSEDPAQRPRSASELRRPLEELQLQLLREPEPEPEPGEPESPESSLGVGARWGIAAAFLLLVLIVAWVVWPGSDRQEREVEAATEAEEEAPATGLVDLAVLPLASADGLEDRLLAAGFGQEVTRLLALENGLSVMAASSAALAVTGESTAAERGRRLGAAHLLEGSFAWQREAEMSRAEVALRLLRTSDGAVIWARTIEGFFGEIIELQDEVATLVARRLGVQGGGGSRSRLTGSLGAYTLYLEGVGRMATATGPAELRAAAASFEQAVILDPGLVLAHARLARLHVALHAAEPSGGHLAVARGIMAKARRLDADNAEVRRAAGELEMASGGDLALAREELTTALERLADDSELRRALALIDRQQGRWEEAIESLTAARRLDPGNLDLLTILVETLAWQRRFDAAAEHVERTRLLVPDAVEIGLLRADLLLHGRGAVQRARVVLEAMPERARSDPRWQERMLRLDLCEGRYESALARLPRLDRDEEETLVEEAWIHHHMGDAQLAAAGFERARDLLDDRLLAAPAEPRLSALLGQAYAGTGGARLGIRVGQRAVAQVPVTVDAVAGAVLVERLARTYVLAGDLEHALDELAFLLEVPSPVTVALLRLDPVWEPLRDRPRFQSLLEHYRP
jgi:serine/threonine-protein kinase